MSLLSLEYILFLLCAALIYYCFPKRMRWYWLLFVSVFFFMLSCEWTLLLYLLAGVLATYLGAYWMEQTENEKTRKRLLRGTLFILLGSLLILKDQNILSDAMNALFNLFGGSFQMSRFSMLAPIGISYFSLSTTGYVLDVYWRTYPAEKDPLRIALFMCYFPQMTSGPITRYNSMRTELFEQRAFDYTTVTFGIQRMLWGYFKKILIADRLILFCNTVLSNSADHTSPVVAIATISYAFYIYTDFSGCMDIIIGSSEVFGVHLPENFQRPFFSLSLGEFWRRWHISLGLWFKDYLLYPLLKSGVFQWIGSLGKAVFGKKRGKKLPTYLGLSILWIAIGLWHGGTWKFVFVSGVLPGFFLISGEMLASVWAWLKVAFHVNTNCFSYRLFCRIRTFFLMCCVFYFASIPLEVFGGPLHTLNIIKQFCYTFSDFSVLAWMESSIFGLGLSEAQFLNILFCLVAVLVCGVFQERGMHIRARLAQQNMVFRWAVYIFVVLIILLTAAGTTTVTREFMYANF